MLTGNLLFKPHYTAYQILHMTLVLFACAQVWTATHQHQRALSSYLDVYTLLWEETV